ncbi:MAG: hypothetical protein GY804_08835 [Alphaproteobacteria bacterium]|nr:hypothetical protein [Alphaproteobacteria bacterium]
MKKNFIITKELVSIVNRLVPDASGFLKRCGFIGLDTAAFEHRGSGPFKNALDALEEALEIQNSIEHYEKDGIPIEVIRYPDGSVVKKKYDLFGRVIYSEEEHPDGIIEPFINEYRYTVNDPEDLSGTCVTTGYKNGSLATTVLNRTGGLVHQQDTQGRWNKTQYNDKNNVIRCETDEYTVDITRDHNENIVKTIKVPHDSSDTIIKTYTLDHKGNILKKYINNELKIDNCFVYDDEDRLVEIRKKYPKNNSTYSILRVKYNKYITEQVAQRLETMCDGYMDGFLKINKFVGRTTKSFRFKGDLYDIFTKLWIYERNKFYRRTYDKKKREVRRQNDSRCITVYYDDQDRIVKTITRYLRSKKIAEHKSKYTWEGVETSVRVDGKYIHTKIYDCDNKIIAIKIGDEVVSRLMYDADNRLSYIKCINGNTSNYFYNNIGLLVELRKKKGDSEIVSKFNYDSKGNRVKNETNGEAYYDREFIYDDHNRLITIKNFNEVICSIGYMY